MRQCVICGRFMPTRKCPDDGWPTLRLVAAGGKIRKGTLIGGRYRVDAEIGRGGFGRVYGGVDTRTEQQIAVKVLSKLDGHEPGESTRRFVREAAVTAELTHGNIIRVIDYGQTDERQFFLVMERLHGEPLSARFVRLRTQGATMSPAELTAVGCGALQGLGAAHERKLVHRDVKPENIFLHRLSTGGEMVKVLDFGIVRPKGSEMTMAGQPLGTPSHMSPEQAQGQPIDARSDLYALGVVLYECAAGRLPFLESPSSLVTMMMHVSETVPPLAETAPHIHPSVAAVIHRALEKDPADRWQTAREMREALRAAGPAQRRASGGHLQVPAPAPPRTARTSGRKNWKDTHAQLAHRRASRMARAQGIEAPPADAQRPVPAPAPLADQEITRPVMAAASRPPSEERERSVDLGHAAPTQLLPAVVLDDPPVSRPRHRRR